MRRAILDLTETFGSRYPRGQEYLESIDSLTGALAVGDATAISQFEWLRQEALLANPLLEHRALLLVKRRPGPARGEPGLEIGMPSNHECNSSLPRTGYDNALCLLTPVAPEGELRELYRPPDGGYVGEINLHWDANRLLFTQSDAIHWRVFELCLSDSVARPVSSLPDDVDSFDACYLPDGRIVFGSTASYQSVPCWHGQRLVSNLYLMNADGSGVRQLCYDQDHNLHPVVLPTGQVLYHRWDYTGINHIFLRQLMLMNPDGTGQRAIYGSGSWFPNALYFPRPLPGDATRFVCILSGYHGVHRMGQLVLIDVTRGWHEADGIVQRISGRGDPIRPLIRDNLVDDDWPKFLHPYPLSDKYFLVSAWLEPEASWGIYLADVFDNLVLVREEPGHALLEPILLEATPKPPIIPDRVDLSRADGVVYLHDIYAGPGLAGVPRGTIHSLRLLAYDFGYPGLAGPDLIGYGGPWEVMRILGTTPVEADGSALFRVPANTPLAVQPLDTEGKAVQLMRSWFTVMPGEIASCVGCHESPPEAPIPSLALAARRQPRELTPWHGPARGFDFGREVQPLLDRHCVRCHNGGGFEGANAHALSSPSPVEQGHAVPLHRKVVPPDLRSAEAAPDYHGQRLSQMAIDRLHPEMRQTTGGYIRFSPAYDALLHHIRRVGIEDDVTMLTPGEYHADTSPLIQMLRKGHQGVRLEAGDWDRLVTWIDLNAPFHGTWSQVHPIPDGVHARRLELRRQFGGPHDDPEEVPVLKDPKPRNMTRKPEMEQAAEAAVDCESRIPPVWDTTLSLPDEKKIDLGDGVLLRLVRVPAGEFLMGDPQGQPDERPVTRVVIADSFWMAALEITNEQYRLFDPKHDSRTYQKRYPPVADDVPDWIGPDAKGLSLNQDRQPVVRVSWEEAMAFCRWLSTRTGRHFTLPTEAQWEWACRAGTVTPWSFGNADRDFSCWANLADLSFSRGLGRDGKQVTGGLEHLVLEGAALSDTRFDDGAVVTAPVGSYAPNAWGLRDLHGNAAEWTLTTYGPYPYREDDGRNDGRPGTRKVVRGGSFFDPPARSRSASRLAYPSWQRVFNVGFRVVAGDTDAVERESERNQSEN